MPYLEWPRFIQLETQIKCNATCTICPNQFLDRPDMPTEAIHAIIDECVGKPLDELALFFTNEPFEDRRLFDLMDYAGDKIPETKMSLYSNMSLTTKRNAIKLLERPNFKFIAFSLDGASKDIFEQARPGLNWDKVKRNCDQFLELRKEMGREDIWVKAVMTLTPQNESDRQPFESMWQGRVDEVMTMGSDGRAFLGTDLKQVQDAGKVGWYKNDPRWPCRRDNCHNTKMFILSDGHCTPCCKAVFPMTSLGNVFEQSLEEIWHGEEYNRLRMKLDNGIYDEKVCKACPMWG